MKLEKQIDNYREEIRGDREKKEDERKNAKSKAKWSLIKAAAVTLGVITAVNSPYIIDQTEQAVITQFGNPKRVILNPVKGRSDELKVVELKQKYQKEGIGVSEGAGLYFKIPFIQSVNKYDRRLQRWDGSPEEIPTLDKKYIWVDTTARWFIDDPLQYLRRTISIDQGLGRLDEIIDASTRNAITKRNLIEAVRTDNRPMHITEEELRESLNVGDVKEGRNKITEEIAKNSREQCGEYGIGIYSKNGVLIKGLTYVESVKLQVEGRMISERTRIAERITSEGEGEYQNIMGQKIRRVNEISSGAYKTARGIEGAADAEATRIYADAYGKNPEFYRFTKTLNVYENSIGKEDQLVIGTDNPLFNLFKGNIKK